ncbi:Carbohydrate kinase PfkB [Corchorus capsularis]|uniref:Carbohydrate kinase PfkB n=1 Tax=Corchorus capsularis TaxID=210143 RepID=A0A1R3HCL3_COCAP|nr:Carbohydrate kinase PfkB [Corchorus capsularis]
MAKNGVASDKKLIVTFGEMLVDFISAVSGVSLAEAPQLRQFRRRSTGQRGSRCLKTRTQIRFHRKTGRRRVGSHAMLAQILKKNGVCVEGILFEQGARTGLAFVSLRADGEREFMYYRNPSADMLFKAEDLNLHLITSIMNLVSNLFFFGRRSAHMKAIEVAKQAGALLSFDPNVGLSLWPSAEEARKQILSVWDKADIIKVSDVELEFLTGSNYEIDDETAMKLWHPNLTLLLVTLGEKGSRYYTKKFHGAVHTFHVNTVDTTCAGDSFVGALLCKIVDDPTILENESKLREVLKFSNACGAITTTKKGAILALPTETDVLPLINGI